MKQGLEKIRATGFWAKDLMMGGKVSKHYKEIQFILENYNSQESLKLRSNYLLQLLNHATHSCEFYKPFRSSRSLSDFPVINKSIIREKFDTVQSHTFKNKKNYKMSTSGSSGTPFTTLQNTDKKIRNTADTLFFKQKAGFKLGHRIYYIRKWFKMHKKNRITAWLQNVIMVNVTDFSDEYIARLIAKIQNDRSHVALIGYSSALKDICKYLDKIKSDPIKSNITCIVAMSETLTDYTREALEKYFNVPIMMRYSNLENGVLSMQLPNAGPGLQINWASYFIEILHPEKDEPVPYGELGRVVVTDLFNYCMPMIRYDTGDMAIMTEQKGTFNSAPVLSYVQGRKMDAIYDTLGRVQSTFIVFHMEAYPELKQFQFIQEDKNHYTIKLNIEGNFTSEMELINLFKGYLGNDAQITVIYVDEIPQLASGKRRLTINNYISETA